MDEIMKLLNDFRQNPIPIIGKKSLDKMITYVTGYIHCMHIRDGKSPGFLPGFQKFIDEYYNIDSAYHWSEIIQSFCLSDEEAFDKFFILLDEFMSEQQTGDE